MTLEEAVEKLKILKEDYWDDDGYGHESKLYDDTALALDMAIKSLEERKTDDLIVLQFDSLMRAQDIEDERQRILAQIENDGVVVLPGYMHVAYIGSKCDVEIREEE